MKKETVVFARLEYQKPVCIEKSLEIELNILFSAAQGEDSEFEDEEW